MPAQTEAAPTIQERVLSIGVGSPVEVRLKDKRKLRGRMGAATERGFSIQYAQGGQAAGENLAFTDVRSIKELDTGMSLATKIVLGSIAAAGAFVFIVLAIYARG